MVFQDCALYPHMTVADHLPEIVAQFYADLVPAA